MIKLILLDIDGVVTDGKLQINALGEEVKQIDFKDIDAIFELKRRNYKLGMITGENTGITEYFKKRFEPDYFYTGSKDKASKIKEIEKQTGIKKEEICYVGDGKNDVAAIGYAGLGVCPQNAINEAKQAANIVLKSSSGDGCIYELLNILTELDNNSDYESNFFQQICQQHIVMFDKLSKDRVLQSQVIKAANLITEAFRQGGQLLLCGNGGSAADAQHIATEFVSRFYLERKALNAEALTVNTSSLTAIGNDYEFDQIFARQVEAKGKKGDILIGISTSGKSRNVLKALKVAKELEMKTIALVGENIYLPINDCSDVLISIPSNLTPRIQEAHIFLGHLICQYVEEKLFA